MLKSPTNEFHHLSEEYIKQTNLSQRKKYGQYFTPKSIRDKLLSYLPQIESPTILDPSCGTGEFLLSASEIWQDAKLYGWEIDEKLTTIAHTIIPKAKITIQDSLQTKLNQKFDFIIGNPPYFEVKLTNKQKEKYSEILGGRMNIFSLFIKLSIDLLKPNGYLGFVVPPSMNNGAYFANLRKYIMAHTDIQHLELISSSSIFTNAQQQVMILILKKQKNSKKYVFTKNKLTIFTPNKMKLKQAFTNKTTLFESGFRVKTGSIVWNTNKEKLTNSAQNNTLLIWSHNIKNQKLTLHNNKKPQYIDNKISESGPAILVNRIIGTSINTRIRAVFVPKSTRFLAENHVNIIYPPSEINGKKVTNKLLQSIVNQISSDETTALIRNISGNTQLSKTELWKLIPIYTD